MGGSASFLTTLQSKVAILCCIAATWLQTTHFRMQSEQATAKSSATSLCQLVRGKQLSTEKISSTMLHCCGSKGGKGVWINRSEHENHNVISRVNTLQNKCRTMFGNTAVFTVVLRKRGEQQQLFRDHRCHSSSPHFNCLKAR